jgi:hypothetical protein
MYLAGAQLQVSCFLNATKLYANVFCDEISGPHLHLHPLKSVYKYIDVTHLAESSVEGDPILASDPYPTKPSLTSLLGVILVTVSIYSSLDRRQSFWLLIQRSRVRFPALPDFLRCRRSGTGFTQPREDN